LASGERLGSTPCFGGRGRFLPARAVELENLLEVFLDVCVHSVDFSLDPSYFLEEFLLFSLELQCGVEVVGFCVGGFRVCVIFYGIHV